MKRLFWSSPPRQFGRSLSSAGWIAPGFRADPAAMRAGLIANGYQELVINSRHTSAVLALPHLHADPFDRILVAQAQIEGMRLITIDKKVAAYGPWVERV